MLFLEGKNNEPSMLEGVRMCWWQHITAQPQSCLCRTLLSICFSPSKHDMGEYFLYKQVQQTLSFKPQLTLTVNNDIVEHRGESGGQLFSRGDRKKVRYMGRVQGEQWGQHTLCPSHPICSHLMDWNLLYHVFFSHSGDKGNGTVTVAANYEICWTGMVAFWLCFSQSLITLLPNVFS